MTRKTIGSFFSKISGTTFENRQSMIPYIKSGEQLVLEHEPENERDSSAIKILRSNGWHVGYISSDINDELLEYSDGTVYCFASEVTGGGYGKNYGCNILIVKVPNGFSNNEINEYVEKTISKNTQSVTQHPFLKKNEHEEISQEYNYVALALLFIVSFPIAIFLIIACLKLVVLYKYYLISGLILSTIGVLIYKFKTELTIGFLSVKTFITELLFTPHPESEYPTWLRWAIIVGIVFPLILVGFVARNTIR